VAWVRLDEAFSEHPKIQKVGPLGVSLFTTGLAYCNRNLTDGDIPERQAMALADWSSDRGALAKPQDLIDALVAANLWELRPTGYYVHDYPKYQPTKAEVNDRKAMKRAAGQAGGKATATARAKAGAKANRVAKTQPDTDTDTDTVPVSDSGTVVKRARFVPPTLLEVSNYCLERKNKINPEKWYSHYVSNGWRVGRVKMTDWKASIVNWETNGYDQAPNGKITAEGVIAFGKRLKEEELRHEQG
jgi:hypothetical protein